MAKTALLAEELLPRIFFVYEATINQSFRVRILSLIDKTLSLFSPDVLQTSVRSAQSFAHFIAQIMRTRHLPSILISLQTAAKVMQVQPHRFAIPLKREGVETLIRELSSADSFKTAFGIRADVDVLAPDFDWEIHTLKETQAYLRVYAPDDHVQLDTVGRRLSELVERQRYR